MAAMNQPSDGWPYGSTIDSTKSLRPQQSNFSCPGAAGLQGIPAPPTSVETGPRCQPEPDLVDIERVLSGSSTLRVAINTLHYNLPQQLATDSVHDALRELHIKLGERELREIRDYGPREYLLIKPLAPDAGGIFANQAAQHVRALDDLGLIVRLDL